MSASELTKSAVTLKQGLAPGTAVFIGEQRTHETTLDIIDYGEDHVVEREDVEIEECVRLLARPGITWINVNGIHETKLIETLGERFGLHPLTIEDIVNTTQRPKMEEFDDYIFIVVRMLYYSKERDEVANEQVSLIVGPEYVISFQERSEDVFEAVRARIRNNKGRLRKMKADYLAYALMDCVVDGYFLILEKLGEEIEALEDEIVESPESNTMQRIHYLKREVLHIRKSVWPLREEIAALLRSESPIIQEPTYAYFRDVHDHAIRIIDTVETYRDMLMGMHDTYLTAVSNRMNEVMKLLTIIATIFIPLTFVVGVYGMNFYNMPELSWRYGYLGVWTAMAAIVLGMIAYFRRKGWL